MMKLASALAYLNLCLYNSRILSELFYTIAPDTGSTDSGPINASKC
jgi:hypothetical protein